MRSIPLRTATAVLAGAALVLGAAPALADEIVVRDLETCATRSIPVFEVTSETWAEVKYRKRNRGTEVTLPTITVVDIKRDSKDANVKSLADAVSELERGNYGVAAQALDSITGAGWRVDPGTGERKYTPFDTGDPPGKNKRPPWIREYAHFYFAKARLMDGIARKDRDAVEDALLALEDVAVPGGDGKETTGGFLGRFQGGNSRFYAEALWLRAKALVFLARYDDAKEAFTQLHNDSLKVGLDPRWAYEGKMGAGAIAEAQGKLVEAQTAYKAAGIALLQMLKDEQRQCLRGELGRYYSLARIRVAAVMLSDAEKSNSGPAYMKLAAFVDGGSPEKLRGVARKEGLTKGAADALIAGARDPNVQAIALNAEGLANLNASPPRPEQALIAFKAVTVKYFQVGEEPARALFYLAKAADMASKNAKGDARAMYVNMRAEAAKALRAKYPDSSWANKGG